MNAMQAQNRVTIVNLPVRRAAVRMKRALQQPDAQVIVLVVTAPLHDERARPRRRGRPTPLGDTQALPDGYTRRKVWRPHGSKAVPLRLKKWTDPQTRAPRVALIEGLAHPRLRTLRGRAFNSVSALATAIVGYQTDGFVFFGIDRGQIHESLLAVAAAGAR